MIGGLLFFATKVSYIDRQILSLLKPILDDQLKWTNAQFGMINSAFQATDASVCLPLDGPLTGMVLDKFAKGDAIIFGFCAFAYVVAFALNHWMAPRFEPVDFPSNKLHQG